MQKIYFANDHAGIELKQNLINSLDKGLYEVHDLGCHDIGVSVDYPDYAQKLAAHMQLEQEKDFKGVLICGTGIGISIAANRYKFIRAALCHHPLEARLAREHNDANILVLGARMIGGEVAIESLNAFLNTEFTGGRHQRRVTKLS